MSSDKTPYRESDTPDIDTLLTRLGELKSKNEILEAKYKRLKEPRQFLSNLFNISTPTKRLLRDICMYVGALIIIPILVFAIIFFGAQEKRERQQTNYKHKIPYRAKQAVWKQGYSNHLIVEVSCDIENHIENLEVAHCEVHTADRQVIKLECSSYGCL